MRFLNKVTALKRWSAAEVLKHHAMFSTAAIQNHVRDEILRHKNWVLKDIPLADFGERHTLESIVERYTAKTTKAPPVIAVERDGLYEILDGAHRVEAARLRGESSHEAFVPA